MTAKDRLVERACQEAAVRARIEARTLTLVVEVRPMAPRAAPARAARPRRALLRRRRGA